MNPVVQFFIMIQISITRFHMGVTLSIGNHLPSSKEYSRWLPNRTNQISVIVRFSTPSFLVAAAAAAAAAASIYQTEPEQSSFLPL